MGDEDLVLAAKLIDCPDEVTKLRVLDIYNIRLGQNDYMCSHLRCIPMPGGPFAKHDVAIVMIKYKQTLADVIRERGAAFFTDVRRARVAHAVLHALAHLHGKDLIHRDAKVTNISFQQVDTE